MVIYSEPFDKKILLELQTRVENPATQEKIKNIIYSLCK